MIIKVGSHYTPVQYLQMRCRARRMARHRSTVIDAAHIAWTRALLEENG